MRVIKIEKRMAIPIKYFKKTALVFLFHNRRWKLFAALFPLKNNENEEKRIKIAAREIKIISIISGDNKPKAWSSIKKLSNIYLYV